MDAVLPIFFELREESPTLITDRYPPLTRDGASLVLTACIMMVLTTLWTIMRFISRRITGISFHMEDYFYFSGQLLYYGVATCFILGVILGGAGHDVSVLDPNLHISHFVKIFLAAQVLYASELLAIKLSIITLMQRIFSQSSSWFRATSWVAVGLSCIWALYTALLGFVICQPIQSAWDINVTKTGCGDYTLAFSAVAIFDIITDIVIVVLPIKVVSGLQMARAHKIALCVVFGAGFM
ncbi:integral membrane protein [Colletotrichum filicis]|nr:integral membrane protein [Colletotrichum filicis]